MLFSVQPGARHFSRRSMVCLQAPCDADYPCLEVEHNRFLDELVRSIALTHTGDHFNATKTSDIFHP